MTVTLNERAYRYARQLIEDGCYVLDNRDEWSKHQASTQRENEFIERHGIGEYARWHLGIDDEMSGTCTEAWTPTHH
jgi:hypothetical protein